MTARGFAAATALAAPLFCLVGAGPAFAQNVSTINSARVSAREFNDDPTSNFTSTNTYPALISLSDQSVDKNGAAGGFANRHVWRFSNDGGATDFLFSNDSFFDVSMTVNLSGNATPRKEAGYLFDTAGGQGQFLVNSDEISPGVGKIVAFGGPFPFFDFTTLGLTYTLNSPITLGMTYFLDPTDGLRKIIYRADGLSSPALAFTNVEQGIINGTRLGGYLQVGVDSTNPNNGATATFSNISIQAPGQVIPEPGSLLLCAVGGLSTLAPLAARHRRRQRRS